VLARVEQGRIPQADLHAWLDEALTRPDDRALFDLATSGLTSTSSRGGG